ncbi:MAG: nucleotidyl transferase AbiEii/AbiGii toxin family protein, partial [Candidatus Thorarchaeota archaeon]|nr:nucleotidyl transferase AbiEii/AbiGii toxin family protein [Candidatus Thorarchaeota archaeon]
EVLLKVLEEIYRNQILKDHLSLIGGAAFHLVHSKEYPPPRLTMDADFNFRNVRTLDDSDRLDSSRNQIDTEIKKILLSMGAEESDIKIDAKYPLGRFIVTLPDIENKPVSILLEIGYTKRISLLGDSHLPLSKTSVEVTTPVIEELHAGKLAALFSRATPRDMFDVWLLSRSTNMDLSRFRKCFIIESMASLDLPFFEVNLVELLDSISFDSGLQNLLPRKVYSQEHFKMIRKEVNDFIVKLISQLTENEKKGVIKFYNSHIFDRSLIDPSGILHERVREYPALTWNLEKLRQEREDSK